LPVCICARKKNFVFEVFVFLFFPEINAFFASASLICSEKRAAAPWRTWVGFSLARAQTTSSRAPPPTPTGAQTPQEGKVWVNGQCEG
jgi:hypothetical protein